MEELDELEYSKLPKQETLLEQLEIEIEVASLNSIDDDDLTQQPYTFLRQSPDSSTSTGGSTTRVHVTGKIKKDVAMLSSALDNLIASIDSIPSLQSNEIKQRKKQLSNVAVQLLERIDIVISRIHHQ